VRTISLGGIGFRYLIAFAMVALTWNPSPYNYIRWGANHWADLMPVVILFGLIMFVGWGVFLRATMRSLGTFGLLLSVAIAGALLWVMVFYGFINLTNTSALGWVLLALLAAILTAGMSWSHLRRRWSGQADIDDVDEVSG
jgi:O-antigen/teichoic acid export membrane protein